MAVITRPDIAFTVSQLTRFLINPGPLYYKITDKVINYLANIKDLALYFKGFNNLEMVNKVLFVNNTLNRKSSQAFIIKLFKGLILWKANKQDTVIIFLIKAELLILLQAVKESLYILRLIIELRV